MADPSRIPRKHIAIAGPRMVRANLPQETRARNEERFRSQLEVESSDHEARIQILEAALIDAQARIAALEAKVP